MTLEMKRLEGEPHIHATIQNNILENNIYFNFLRFLHHISFLSPPPFQTLNKVIK